MGGTFIVDIVPEVRPSAVVLAVDAALASGGGGGGASRDAFRLGAAVVFGLAATAAAAWLLARGAAARRRGVTAQVRLAALVDSSDDAIVSKSVDGVIQSWNAGAEALFGYTAEEAIGRPITLIVPPDRLDEELDVLARIARGERIENFETVRLTKAGRRIEVSVTLALVRDADGRVTGAWKIAHDVTERKRAERRRAREVELWFRDLADQAPFPIWIADEAQGGVWFNRAWLEFTGRTMEQEAGRGWTEGVHPEDVERLLGIYAESFEARRPFEVEYRLRRGDGTYRWLYDKGVPLRGPEGAFTGYIGSCIDVTDHKEAEERALAMAAADAKFRTLFEQGPQLAGVLSSGGVVMEANRTFLESCGDARDEVVGRPFWECGCWARSPEASATVRSACLGAAAGETFRAALPYFPADGSEWFIDLMIAPVRDEAGRVLFLSPTGTDVTESRRASEIARASAARFREFADSAPAMLWVTDPEGDATFLSRGWFDFTGQRPDEGLGMGWLAAVHPDDRARVEAAFLTVVADRSPYLMEHRLRRADGGYGWVIDAGRARFSADGEFLGHVGSVVDISSRKAGEESLQRSEERYRTLFTSIDQGFCVIEILFDPEDARPVDYRFVEANPAFGELTGLTDAVGRRILELIPDLEPRWIEAFGEVSRTGRPVRNVQEATSLGRWFDIYAFRIGAAEPGLVAVLFTDITARVRHEEERERLHRQVAEERGRLIQAFEQSPAFVAVIRGPDHVFERVNARFSDLIGPREVMGRPVREALPEAGDQGYLEILGEVYRTGQPYVADDRRVLIARGPAGEMEERWLEFVLQPLRGPAGEVSGVIVHGIDLTRRKRAEALLREKDQRLELLLENAADYAVVVTDLDGVVVDWLGGAESITGYGPAEALGRPYDFLFTAEDRAAGMPAREREAAARAGRAEDKRWRIRKDGSPFYCEGVLVPLRDESGLHGFGKVFRDATARKRGEEAVRFLADASATLAELVDHESTLRRIANLAVVGFADWCAVDILDASGNRHRLAVARSERRDDPSDRRTDPTDRDYDEVAGVIPHVLRTGEPEVVFDLDELDAETASQGPERIARLRALGVRSYLSVPLISRGRVVGGISFLASSARRRFGPDELRIGQDLAERTAAAVENAQLYRALQETDRRKDEFLATLAHELRNPLAPVRNGIEILRMEEEEQEEHEEGVEDGVGVGVGDDDGEQSREQILSMMDRQLAHLVRLVDDLMDVSRVTSGKIVLRRERIDLRDVVAAAVETSRQMIDADGHELSVRLPDEPIPVEADRTRLVQVVANLLNNAAKYTPQDGRIDLSVAREGETAVIRVADDGIGIPAEMLPRIFDMFTQVGSSLDRAQGGLGIGLTLVRRLVELHGGTVAVDSPGTARGSVFTVRLPLARNRDRDPARPGDETTAPPPSGTGAAGRRILVIDDNRDSTRSLARLLAMKHHEVRTAFDGPETFRVLESFHPHLILLDLGLPGMSGYEIARRIRQMPDFRDVTIVALTGWGQDEDRRRTQQAGFDHHLVKPAEPAAVEAILAGLQPPAAGGGGGQ
ncbi:PAS domain S-box protein [Planctomyces sp. SH-PL62]|uniref:PAS domain-containing hybrid sensor histidine kinase/response regulator n=1 Tax=Planctomyces sp. SH-PL62 TaxID=1636152 RepID=UPI00078C1A2A|nr:PAS domain S-box protein [Planctomyces sp. SH-PL62]AMV40600.1 Autoinducer 2 sensor kinase/phosphatase LuxQ [Planctomyces sp. SH-PL62]